MGVPLPPPAQEDGPDASVHEDSEEEDEDSPEEAWFEDEQEWEDPSEGGVLSSVLTAAEEGDAGRLASLLGTLSVSVNTRGGDGDTALHLAALYGHTECVRLLMAQGARADVADEEGALPVHDAAAGGYREILEMLLDCAPACVNAPDAEGDTPLHNAARGQYLDCVQLLLDRGADPTLQNDEFKTAVVLAERGSELRQILEEAAAAWEQQESEQQVSGEQAEQREQPQVEELR